jgi:hypothetical protein
MDNWFGGLPAAKVPTLWRAALGRLARASETPDAFADFYRVVFARSLPQHARDEWMPALFAAVDRGEGLIIEAFRGSTKTTTLTIAWLAFRIGQHPAASHLVVAGSDASARAIGRAVAEIIAGNPGWRAAFPHVIPDRAAGWAATGWHVRDTRLPAVAFDVLALRERGKDPSLLGVGYRSSQLIGKHPGGTLVVDDLHDEHNSQDGKALEKARDVLQGTLLPAVTPQTAQLFVGTPWSRADGLAYLKATGQFPSLQTPIVRDGLPAWPERYPLEVIEKERAKVGSSQFARMYLLDLDAAAGTHLKREWLGRIPPAQLDPRAPVILGVDYASTGMGDKQNRDYFAVAVGRALPGGGGMALEGGYRGRLSQGAAQAKLIEIAAHYPTLQLVGVEAVGGGEQFYELMLRTSRLPLRAMHPGRASKAQRFEGGMAPLFEFGRAWLLDAENPFLRAFEEEWADFPHGRHDDTLDAVYWMLRAGLPHLMGAGKPASASRTDNPLLRLGRQ